MTEGKTFKIGVAKGDGTALKEIDKKEILHLVKSVEGVDDATISDLTSGMEVTVTRVEGTKLTTVKDAVKAILKKVELREEEKHPEILRAGTHKYSVR